MRIVFHPLPELPDDLCRFWRETLRRQDPVSVFAGGPEWFVLMAGDDPAMSVVTEVRGDDGAPRAVIPLLVRSWPLDFRLGSKPLAGRRLRVLKVGGGDLVGAGLTPGQLAEVWRAVLNRYPDADAVWFERVTDSGRLDGLKQSGCGTRDLFACVPFERLLHYRLTLPATLEDCLARRSPRSLQRLRGKERALCRQTGSEGRVVEIRSPADWAPYAHGIDRMMNSSWQARLLGQRFCMENFRGVADKGWLRAFLLLQGKTPAAFALCYQGMGVLVSGVLGYDPALARFSPGTILLYRTLERLYTSDTPKVLDFGEGDAEYKEQWASDVTEVGSILLVRNHRHLAAWFRLHRYWNRTQALLRRGLRRAGIDRTLVRLIKRSAGGRKA